MVSDPARRSERDNTTPIQESPDSGGVRAPRSAKIDRRCDSPESQWRHCRSGDRQRRSSIVIFLALALIALWILSCTSKSKAPEESMTAGHAVIGTSDAVFTVAWKLSSAFQSGSPGAFVDIVRNSDRALVDSLLNERTQEIFLDRTLTPAESLAFQKAHLNLYTYKVAYYPVFLLTPKDNPVVALDSVHLKKILTGEIRDWKEVGGDRQPIHVYLPLPGEGAFQVISDFYGKLDSVEAKVCSTAAQMLESAKNDAGALLIYSLPVEELPYKRLYFERDSLQIPANVKTILEEPYYPFRLDVTYVTTRNKMDVAAGYLTFAVSNTGQKEVMHWGYRPAAVPVRIVHVKNNG